MPTRLTQDIVETIGLIHDMVTDGDAASRAVARMAHHLEADKGILVRLARDRRRDISLGHIGMERDLVNRLIGSRENSESFLARNILWQSGAVATDRDCMRSKSGRRATELYKTLYAPNDIEHTLLAVIDSSDVHHVLLWFHRGPSGKPFSSADRRYANTLMPHWQRAVRQKLAYDLNHSALDAARAVLNQSPFGLFILNRDNEIIYVNAEGESQLAADNGLRLRDDSLYFADRDVRAAYAAMLAAVRRGGSDDDPRMQPIAIPKSRSDSNYHVGMQRLRLPQMRGSLATRSVVGVFITDTGRRLELSIDHLHSLYSLTDAEARVCNLVYRSKNLPEAAKILGISINTAKTHLTRAFRKVGVQSQAELVRRLNSQLHIR